MYDLLELTKTAMISSIENYLHEVVDSIESDAGELSDEDVKKVTDGVYNFISENINGFKL